MTEHLNFFTPIGRFVNGSITEKRSIDMDKRPIPADKQKFEFGVAFPKADLWPLLSQQFYPWLMTQAARDTNATQRINAWFGGNFVSAKHGGFSMKIADGDRPDAQGRVNENTKGCFVMYFASSWAPQTVDPSNQNIAAEMVKRGFYVQVSGNIVTNGENGAAFQAGDRAGIYLNGQFLRLCAEGDEIQIGPDAATAFGGVAAPTALPPGARPLGATSGAHGAFGGAPVGFPPGAPAPAPMAPAAPPAAYGAPQTPQQYAAPQPTASAGSYPQVLAGPPAGYAPQTPPTLPPMPPR